jgi:hypothetical protein
MGRSGTQFLAAAMNTSQSWTVLHEPTVTIPPVVTPQRPLFIEVSRVAPRFARARYGEVNSYLRHVILDLPVARKGIILRHPREILLSAANHQRTPLLAAQCDNIAVGLMALRQALHSDPAIRLIYFHPMTTDYQYLVELVAAFGVQDAVITKVTQRTRVNATERIRYTHYEALPGNLRALYEYQLQDFTAEYFSDGHR